MTGTLGTRLRRLRNEKKMRQQDVADAIGVSRNYISELEADKVGISYQALTALAKFFNVTLDELCLGISSLQEEADFAQDSDERALLSLWRSINHIQKKMILSLLVISADEIRGEN